MSLAKKCRLSLLQNHHFTNKFDESSQIGEEREPKDTDIDEVASKKERNIIDPIITERGYPPYSPELNPIEQFRKVLKDSVRRSKLTDVEASL